MSDKEDWPRDSAVVVRAPVVLDVDILKETIESTKKLMHELNQPPKVYLVFSYYNWNGHPFIKGIFTTLEKAKAYLEKVRQTDWQWNCWIEAQEIDSQLSLF